MVAKIFGISTYGIMMAIAFIIGSQLVPKEFKQRNLDKTAPDWLVLTAMLAGIIGSKIAFIIEYRAEIFQAGFAENLVHWGGANEFGIQFKFWTSVFSGGGLTFFGGLIFATIALIYVMKMYEVPILRGFDSLATTMALGYGFGRLGCFVSGDGCFGNAVTTDTWLFPPLVWDYPQGTNFPTGGAVYNTPVYEAMISFMLFGLLMYAKKFATRDGFLAVLFFIVHGTSRFTMEFFRHNTADISFVGIIPGLTKPERLGEDMGASASINHDILAHVHWYGLTQAQLIALTIIILSIIFIIKKKYWILDNPNNKIA